MQAGKKCSFYLFKFSENESTLNLASQRIRIQYIIIKYEIKYGTQPAKIQILWWNRVEARHINTHIPKYARMCVVNTVVNIDQMIWFVTKIEEYKQIYFLPSI